jgi:predicted CopG family antitoxin
MAVKTITIDVEAYDLLAAEKRGTESFSQVIKRRFRKDRTARRLLERLDEVCLRTSTLKEIEKVVAMRGDSVAASPRM